MKNYATYESLAEQEKKAVLEALKNIDCWNIIDDCESLERWYSDGTVSINECRSGRKAAYVLTESEKESAVYVDTLQELTPEEIEKELN